MQRPPRDAPEVHGLRRFPSPAEPARLHREHRVLVVAAEQAERRSWALLLGAFGYRALGVATTEEGLAQLAYQPCDLVLCDMGSAGLGALSLTTTLRQRSETRELPVILVSAHGCTRERIEGLAAGADDVLTKPFDADELAARVEARIVRAKQNMELELLCTRDPLTGLLNRHALVEEVTRELRRSARTGSPLSLAMVDLDDFKAINDQHGHLVGDETLRRVAVKLQAAVRATDRVARFGGDEFVLILADTDESQLHELLVRLRGSWRREPPMVPLAARPVMASIGGATAEPGETMEALICKADLRMYRDKRRAIH